MSTWLGNNILQHMVLAGKKAGNTSLFVISKCGTNEQCKKHLGKVREVDFFLWPICFIYKIKRQWPLVYGGSSVTAVSFQHYFLSVTPFY